MTTTPKHEYEIVEGTKPGAHVTHEPRTVVHTATTGATVETYMMSEIGDGVFVQWGECRRCTKRVDTCRCPEGPQEPPYMKTWRDKRFDRDLNKDRPEPSRELLDSVVQWLKDRGYTVTKKREPKIDPVAQEDYDKSPEAQEILSEAAASPTVVKRRERIGQSDDEGVDPAKVDEGLDAALEKVRAARDLSDIPDEF